MEIARCMKCRSNKLFALEPTYETKITKKGAKGLLRGNCIDCKTSMCKIVKVRKEEWFIMVNINGLDSKAIAEFQMLLIRANNQQLIGLNKMVESEIIKCQMLEESGLYSDYMKVDN